MADDINQQAQGRRSIFRLGLQKLLEPITGYMAERLDFQIPEPVSRTVLRPPGALPEGDFRKTCYHSGNCVDICPARAIRTYSGYETELTGTPYIDPDLAACVVCDELACMKACPSGALKLVDNPSCIAIGLARVQIQYCLRGTGQDCTICVDKCPMGGVAIRIGKDGAVEVQLPGCVGCGSCQFYCPALPKAIVVDPS